MNRLVAFTGPMGCGKTTAASFLAYRGWGVLSFAYPLKRAAMEVFCLTDKQVYTLEGKQTMDPRWGMTPREILQKFGTEALRTVFPGVWVKRMELSILSAGPEVNIVIDDLRFPDEAEVVRKHGGIIIHITDRSAGIIGKETSHTSEQGLPVQVEDLVFRNSGTMEQFKNLVLSIV